MTVKYDKEVDTGQTHLNYSLAIQIKIKLI